ncbi:hypothetical protein ACEPAI_10030 [Sanghuangporus weigelae]
MNSIFAAIALAFKYYMVAQVQGDAGLAYFGFGYEFHQLERGNPIDIWYPVLSFASETFCSPVPVDPIPAVTKTVQYIIDSASVTLKPPLSLPGPAPPWSPSVQPSVNTDVGTGHSPPPTSTYKHVPIEDVLEEPSCINMILIVVLILSTTGVAIGCLISGTSHSVALQTEPSTEGSHRSVLTWPVLSCILVAACFGRVSVPPSLFERILDVLCFFLLFSVSALALLKFPRASFDTAHQQSTSHLSSDSIFADMLSTSIAIESSIEEANTKDECEDSSIPRAGSVNSCVVTPFESVTSNEAGNSSGTVMSTPTNETANNSMIVSKPIIDAGICSGAKDTVSAIALLKFPHVSSDTAHQQRTSHISSESIFVDMLSTSIAIESSIEETTTKDECEDSSIPCTDFVNSCVVAPFESGTSNEAGNSSGTVMSTPTNGTDRNSMIDSKSITDAGICFIDKDTDVSATLTTELDPAYVPLPGDGSKLTAAVPTPFEHDSTHGTTHVEQEPEADESATIADCVPTNISADNGFIDPVIVSLPEPTEAELEINALDVLLEDQSNWETTDVQLEVTGTSTPYKSSWPSNAATWNESDETLSSAPGRTKTNETYHSNGEDDAVIPAPSPPFTQVPVSKPTTDLHTKTTRRSLVLTRSFLLQLRVRGENRRTEGSLSGSRQNNSGKRERVPLSPPDSVS